jgi:hypothetical protein
MSGAHAGFDVRYWHLADILIGPLNVRYWGQSGHDLLRRTRLLLTQSGHAVSSSLNKRSTLNTWSEGTSDHLIRFWRPG